MLELFIDPHDPQIQDVLAWIRIVIWALITACCIKYLRTPKE